MPERFPVRGENPTPRWALPGMKELSSVKGCLRRYSTVPWKSVEPPAISAADIQNWYYIPLLKGGFGSPECSNCFMALANVGEGVLKVPLQSLRVLPWKDEAISSPMGDCFGALPLAMTF